MDIILELTDTFIADYAYAFFFPAQSAPYDFPSVAANGTTQTFSSWTYQPASQFIYVEPSQAAYMSAWSRDNLYRQLITLYFIVWYAHSHSHPSSEE